MPRAYLRVLVFDRDSALVSAQTQQVQLSQAAHGGYEALQAQLVLAQDGYVTAYVGSESDTDVYFDDVSVEHRPGLQVQEVQYDPAGRAGPELDPPRLALLRPPAAALTQPGPRSRRRAGKLVALCLRLRQCRALRRRQWAGAGWGQAALNFTAGILNAMASNATTITGLNGESRSLVARYAPTSLAYSMGQQVGDVLSAGQGVYETVTGAGMAGGGAIGGALTAPTVVGAAVGYGTAAAGMGLAVHGLNTGLNGLRNALGDNHGRVYANSSTSGNNSAAAKGRQAHKDYNPGPTYTTDPKTNRLKNGKIPDGIDRTNRVVSELKPNNPRAIQRGEKQVEGYRKQLEQQTGQKWKSRVDTY